MKLTIIQDHDDELPGMKYVGLSMETVDVGLSHKLQNLFELSAWVRDEHLPDLRKAAAAPDLYAALEGLLDNYKANNASGLGVGPIFKARAALAKARGEAS